MNISSIKNRASEVLMTNKPQYIRNLTILMLVGLIPSLFNGSGTFVRFISLAVTILFLTFQHGYIVSSLKMVRNNAQSLNDDDSFVGFRRFSELFPTYLLISITIWAIMIALVFIFTMIFTIVFGSALTNIGRMISSVAVGGLTGYDLLAYILSNAPYIIFSFLIIFILLIVAAIVVSAFLFAVPYLLEQYKMTTTVAIKESFQLMKNHIWDFIKLQLSFIGWIIMVVVIQSLLTELLSFIPIIGSLIAAIAGGFIGIYTYLPQLYLSQAVFFEELAYHRYEKINQTYGENTHV
ncbi:DUF975 family protein [Candidatus Stoquefichus massiliensis]|uniref:DUF975 family protein n=1 Tax=Candidatus Stoquefichus massiliensis TaxID=1470350 RepID=UPI000489A05E|nr:DUF975 family protein [Candidatus Stoquefichus massiliensis]